MQTDSEGGRKHLSHNHSKEKPIVLERKMGCTQVMPETTSKRDQKLSCSWRCEKVLIKQAMEEANVYIGYDCGNKQADSKETPKVAPFLQTVLSQC